MNNWQPIATAPKDKKSKLVYVPENKCIYCVTWCAGTGWPDEGEDQAGWVIFGTSYKSNLLGKEPSHWMPLPIAPSTEQQ